MLEDLLKVGLATSALDLKRRMRGAVVGGVALGIGGIAFLFACLGAYMLLATVLPDWAAALIVALAAALVALVTFMIARSMLQGGGSDPRSREAEGVGGLLSSATPHDPDKAAQADREAPASLVFTALAAGLVLGRSLRR